MIPVNAQRENIRELFPRYWPIFKAFARDKGGKYGHPSTCEYCGGKSDPSESLAPVDAHEEWNFENGKVEFIKVVPVCRTCHNIKHINFFWNKWYDPANSRFKYLFREYFRLFGENFLNETQAYDYVLQCIDKADKERKQSYTIDKDSIERYYHWIITKAQQEPQKYKKVMKLIEEEYDTNG
jgi:hypothetical protein